MRSIARVLLFLLALVAGAAGAETPDGRWTVREFEVRAVEPVRSRPPTQAQLAEWVRKAGIDLETIHVDAEASFVELLRLLGLMPDGPFTEDLKIDPTARSLIQTHLRESARLLERWGFPAPALQPVVTLPGGQAAYRIYLARGLAGMAGYYRGPSCRFDANGAIIVLDLDAILGRDGQPTPAGLEAVSHELFHAVQRATPFFGEHYCEGRVGGWIAEGTAKAVGWDLTRLLNRARPSDIDWGERRYSDRLPVPLTIRNAHGSNPGAQPDPAYQTASFWRYLAEYQASMHAGGTLPGPEVNPVDYSYLRSMFAMGRTKRDCAASSAPCEGELQWLDLGLKRSFGRSLHEIFPNFGEALVDYGEHRAARDDPDLNGMIWRGEVFDNACTLVELESRPDRDLVHETVKRFSPVSLQCWKVELKNAKESTAVAVTATLPGDSPTAALSLSNLSLAVGGRPMFAYEPLTGTDSQTGETSASWIADLPPDNKGHVLISNVRRDPVLTRAIENLQLTFTPVSSSVTMSTGRQPSDEAIDRNIERPIRIKLDRISAKQVSRDHTPQARRNAANACTMVIGAKNSRTGETLHLAMTHSGPIGPGRYEIARTDAFTSAQDVPGRAAIGFEVPHADGRMQGFFSDSGILEIDTIAGGRMTGRIRAMGHRCSKCVGIGKTPFGVDALAIQAQFSVLLEDPLRKIAALLKATDDDEQPVPRPIGSDCLTNGRRGK